jgi:dolichol-phosphate mannosyltransferase
MKSTDAAHTFDFLSIVVPVYNEEESIKTCIEQIILAVTEAQIDYELIIVNDGSSDMTISICRELKLTHNFRLIHIPINTGHMAAITAGLEASIGKYVATMDADLQDPPKDLVKMYEIITQKESNESQSVDVVQAFRVDRSVDSYLKRRTAGMYYSIIEKIVGFKVVHHAADFRIMKRDVVDILLALPERNRIYRLLIPKLGFVVVPYPIVRGRRYAGETKYSFRKMLKLSVDSVFAFSYKPLRLFSYLGFISSLFFLLASVVTLLISLLFVTVPGWPSVVLLLLSANSFLFAGLGLLGEYVGRIYELVQARPIANWTEVN